MHLGDMYSGRVGCYDAMMVAAELTFERLVDDNFMVIIPLPFDRRLGAAFRLTAQGDIVALAHNDITGGQRIVNVRRHCKIAKGTEGR